MNSRKNREEVVTEVFIFKNKKEFTKIASQIFGKFGLISEEVTSGTPFIRKKELRQEFCHSSFLFIFLNKILASFLQSF